jgi:hypothetical protein
MNIKKGTMAHYHIATDSRSPRRWYVVHTASGKIVTPLRRRNTMDRDEAMQWRDRCESAAPTTDQNEAARLLTEANVPQDWRERIISCHRPMFWKPPRSVKFTPRRSSKKQ